MSSTAKTSRLAAKFAIVTGGSSGYGAGIAKLCASQGAKVLVADINEDGGKRTIQSMPDSMRFHKANVANADDWECLVDLQRSRFGDMHCPVNNPPRVPRTPTLEVTEADFDKYFFHVNVNVKSVFFGTSARYTTATEQKSGGSIHYQHHYHFRGSDETASSGLCGLV